jgi:hypothetical protein
MSSSEGWPKKMQAQSQSKFLNSKAMRLSLAPLGNQPASKPEALKIRGCKTFKKVGLMS